MKCDLCGADSKLIYVTSKYGLICCECNRKTYNSAEEKLKEKEDKLKMYRRYGVNA